MKRFVVVAALLIATAAACGQDKKDPEPPAKGRLPANWSKLGLSEKQVQEVYKVQASYDTKIGVLELQIAKLKAEENTALFAVLSDAQKALLKEILLKKAQP